jgi:hypothetical protein
MSTVRVIITFLRNPYFVLYHALPMLVRNG